MIEFNSDAGDGVNPAAEVVLDPIELEVLRGRLEAIAEEMQDVLLRSSFSTIVTEGGDATAALFDQAGATVAQACAIPVHLGTLSALGKRFAETYPQGEARAGDVYVINDPYDGGTHLPDIAVAAPVFGGELLIGYVATMTHHQDIGGSAPGSVAANPYDLLAEGMRIPMMRLAHGGVVDEALISLLASNSRSPENFRGDLAGQMASCATGTVRFAEVCARTGDTRFHAGIAALMDYAERITRHTIEGIPDGTYTCTDWLDDDGLSVESESPVVTVAITVSGSEMTFDFTGTAAQVRSSINNVRSSTLAAVYFAVRTLTGDQVPNNDGCYRSVHTVLPPGSLVNAEFPAPVAARGVGLLRVVDVVFGAMAQVLPNKAIAAGSGHATVIPAGGSDSSTGERFLGSLGGPLRSGTGARASKDGLDVSDHGLSNAYHIPVEIAEARLPIRFHKLELWTDSGGSGRWRGGLGFVADVEWLRGDATISLRFERQKFQPFGIFGGNPAPSCRVELLTASGEQRVLYGKVVTPLHAGDRLRYWSTGGGGCGDPLLREPARVLDDLRDGRISAQAAHDDYGVVIDSDEVLEAATHQLRERLHKRMAVIV